MSNPEPQPAQPTRSCCAGGATADADAMAELAEYMAERREQAEQELAVTPNRPDQEQA